MIGDFQEPYGAIFGEFSKVDPRFIGLRTQVVSLLCDFGKLLSQPRKCITSLLQPTSAVWQLVSCPSLILHGRTEIKARALVLGEVSALSFCLLAILSITARNKRTKKGARTEAGAGKPISCPLTCAPASSRSLCALFFCAFCAFCTFLWHNSPVKIERGARPCSFANEA